MIRAACHCTTVRMEIEETPTWVTDCNCTLCRRYGALWAYYEADQVKLVQGVDATDTYLWGPKWLAFHRCNVCGCLTHHTVLGTDPPWIRGINARMIPTLDPSSVRVQQTDHGHTGFFWTRSDGPIEPSNQPPPGPDDWR